jgi:hypothetical protein
MKIKTAYKSNHHGAGQILARVAEGAYKGRQLTRGYDHSLNREDNHRETARALAIRLGYPQEAQAQEVVKETDRGFVIEGRI